MRRYGLRDDQWERICGLLPGQRGHAGATAADNRLFVEAVLYRYRAGVPWRDLPERFGAWKNVHTRFSRWSEAGVWERVFLHLAADAAMVDASFLFAVVCVLLYKEYVCEQMQSTAICKHSQIRRRDG